MARTRSTPSKKSAGSAAATAGATSSSPSSAKSTAVSPSSSRSRTQSTTTTTVGSALEAEQKPIPVAATISPEISFTAVLDILLVLLLSTSLTRAWRRQFAPIHGSGATQLGLSSTFMYDSAVAILLYRSTDLRQISRSISPISGPFPSAPWVFLVLACVQPAQFVLGALDVQAFAVAVIEAIAIRALAFFLQPVILRTWFVLDRAGDVPPALLKVLGTAGVYLFLTAFRSAWAQFDLLGAWLAPGIEAEYLPHIWAFPLSVSVIAVGRALLRHRALRAAAQEAVDVIAAAAKARDGPASAKRPGVKLGGVPTLLFALLAVLPLLHSAILNTHSPFPVVREQLDDRLGKLGWELLTRADGGGTGYISVLHSKQEGYTILRSDHSILGGVFDRSAGEHKEPIYAVFVMLEAVRLMVPAGEGRRKEDKGADALVIGLGIGTAPSALVAHGINTTIVELDPVVVSLAIEHFAVPRPGPLTTIALEDAVSFVKRASRISMPFIVADEEEEAHKQYNPAKQYAYIVHDVFTGGVEPAALFTHEFLSGLRRLLRDDGAIAINYAGDLSLDTPKLVLRTILTVFDNNCRIFREFEHPTTEDTTGTDQTNVVVFCRKDGREFDFAAPRESDFLNTQCRRNFLVPRFEMKREQRDFGMGSVNSKKGALDLGDPGQILWNGNVPYLDKMQREAAENHRALMREVVPAGVWVNY